MKRFLTKKSSLVALSFVGTISGIVFSSFVIPSVDNNLQTSNNLTNQGANLQLNDKSYKFSVEDQSNTLFRLNDHTQLFDYNSIGIDPQSSWRSTVNTYGYTLGNNSDYYALANPYTNLLHANQEIKNGQFPDANTLYYAILSIVGPSKFLDYINYDRASHPNNVLQWTAMSEIVNMSNYWHLNLYPMLKSWKNKFYRNNSPFDWEEHDRPRFIWPGDMDHATDDEKRMIDGISNLTAPEFVGNLYAVGAYTPNSSNPSDFNAYSDADDLLAPIALPCDRPYTFDFGKYIVSTNDDFKWTNLQVSNLNLHGGSLQVKDKIVIYNPSLKNVNEIDSFDVSICNATNYHGSSDKMQKVYKWRIKISKTFNEPIFSLYSPYNENTHIGVSDKQIASYVSDLRQSKPIAQWVNNNFDQFHPDNKKQGFRCEFKFVVPYDGYYSFMTKFDDLLNISVNISGRNSRWFVRTFNQWTPNEINLNRDGTSDYLYAGDVVNFDIFVINTGGIGNFDFSILYKPYPLSKNQDKTDEFMETSIYLPHVNVNKSNMTSRSATINKTAKPWKYIYTIRTSKTSWTNGARFSKFALPINEQWRTDNKNTIFKNFELLKTTRPDSKWVSSNLNLSSISPHCAYRMQFNFVAPASGYYKFFATFDDYLCCTMADGVHKEYSTVFNHWTNQWTNICPEAIFALKAGETFTFDIFVMNVDGPGNFNMKVQYNNRLTNDDLDHWPNWENNYKDIPNCSKYFYTN
ncbi:hypothetical protein [Mycoplasmoides alvi]|uniref:hypothetical protein n=1 Tax=Mycoplasmoides alvi TaxID=78580 RepID=UPI00051B9CF7|nr:hypothetical protein [Mycoplasmoides alvi]